MISPNHTEPVEKQSVILSREITKLLPEFANRYACSICEAKFGTYYNWKNHHYICSGVKPKRSKSKQTEYKCNYDDCEFISRRKIKIRNMTFVGKFVVLW